MNSGRVAEWPSGRVAARGRQANGSIVVAVILSLSHWATGPLGHSRAEAATTSDESMPMFDTAAYAQAMEQGVEAFRRSDLDVAARLRFGHGAARCAAISGAAPTATSRADAATSDADPTTGVF